MISGHDLWLPMDIEVGVENTLGRANHIPATSTKFEVPMAAAGACENTSITINASPTMHAVRHCANCKRRTGSAIDISPYFDKTAVVAYEADSMIFALQHDAQNRDRERHFYARSGPTFLWHRSVPLEKMRFATGCFGEAATLELDIPARLTIEKPCVTLASEWTVHAQRSAA